MASRPCAATIRRISICGIRTKTGWCVSKQELRGTMNDPKVVALIYIVEHRNSFSYENVGPLRYCGSREFDLAVEDKIARFELKKFYVSEGEALKAVEPFIQHWEFEAAMQVGPGSFRLRYKKAEIVDRNPSPPEPSSGPLQASARASFEVDFSVSAPATLVSPHYPPPPASGSVDPDDYHVVMMKDRYEQYCLRRATLPDVAYFCVTALVDKYGSLPEAAKECGISSKVLKEIRKLSSNKGGEDSRKAEGFDDEFTRQEKQFLNLAIPKIILRAAQVAADDSQRHPQITMAHLPSI